MPISHGINIDDQGRQIMTQEVSGDAYISDGKLINPDGTQVVVIDTTNTVNLTGDQTVAGVKTFSSSPVVPTATTGTQAINKYQMDTADALKVNKAGDTSTGQQVVDSGASIGGWRAKRGTNDIAFIAGNSNGRGIIYDYVSGASQLETSSTGISLGNWNNIEPQILKGTGFPNGVVSAPVGSIYIDTAATGGITHWYKLSGSGNTGYVPQNLSSTVPASASAVGIAGQQAYNANYLYICVATNTWKRVAIASW